MTRQNTSQSPNPKPAQRHGRVQRLGARPITRLRHSKGFTLVELMVVIVIVGILSAVALPKFLGIKGKAKLNTQMGEAAGLAKECSAAIIADGPYPADYPSLSTNTGLKISGNCNNGSGLAPTATTITFKTTGGKGDEGVTCGTEKLDSAKPNCTFTLTTSTGDITPTAST